MQEDQLIGVEVFRERDSPDSSVPIAFAALHVLAPEDAVAEADQLDWWTDLIDDRRREGALWSRFAELLGGSIDLSAPARHLAFVATDLAGRDALALAYATTTGIDNSVTEDVRSRSDLHDWTITKPDWSALVLRDGATFVSHQTSNENFGPTLRMLMHTIHLDALLLAVLQRRLIDRSGNRATEVDLEEPQELVELEKAHYEFKRKYWRTSVTDKRTAPPDVVFRAFQEELLTTLDVNDVETRVRDGARLSMSMNAARQELAQEKLSRVVQTATVVIGALGLSFTAAPVIHAPSWSLFWIALAVGALAMSCAFLALHITGRRVMAAGRRPSEARRAGRPGNGER